MATGGSPRSPISDTPVSPDDSTRHRLQLERLQSSLRSKGGAEDDDSDSDLCSDGTSDAERLAAMSARWAEARSRMVEVACSQRDAMLQQKVLHGWKGLVWRRRLRQLDKAPPPLPPPPLQLLASLEEQRQESTQKLHDAQLESRWHRQRVGGLLRLRLMLALWAERTLQRCWLAWGAHLDTMRMGRELRSDLRQLVLTLRVSTLSKGRAVLDAFRRASLQEGAGAGRPQQQLLQRQQLPADAYARCVYRRAWLGWAFLVARRRMSREFAADERLHALAACLGEWRFSLAAASLDEWQEAEASGVLISLWGDAYTGLLDAAPIHRSRSWY